MLVVVILINSNSNIYVNSINRLRIHVYDTLTLVDGAYNMLGLCAARPSSFMLSVFEGVRATLKTIVTPFDPKRYC